MEQAHKKTCQDLKLIFSVTLKETEKKRTQKKIKSKTKFWTLIR